MRSVTPEVFLIGQSAVVEQGMKDYLASLGVADWETDAPTPVEELIEVASRSCYMSFGTDLNPNIKRTREGNEAHIANIIKVGHGSVLEHASVTFAFRNVSRVFTHELVRHRAGAAVSQESLRFVRLDDIPFFIPPAFQGDDVDSKAMQRHMESMVESSEEHYGHILNLAAKKEGFDSFDDLPFDRKKYYTSAARRVAPIGTATNIIWTANMRTLRHVIEMRTDPSAEEEIRFVFGKVAEIASSCWPNVFGDYTVEIDDNDMPLVTFKSKKV